MDNITSKETMEEFIGKIIDGQGNFFKPLSKSDLYKLATRIRELEAELKALRESQGGNESPQMTLFDECASPAVGASDAEDTNVNAERCEKFHAEGDESIPATDAADIPQDGSPVLTWREVLEQRGADAQDAFDEFIRWREKHPKQNSVMDFSTGKKSAGAAFAYWLTGKYQEE